MSKPALTALWMLRTYRNNPQMWNYALGYAEAIRWVAPDWEMFYLDQIKGGKA